ncbi:MAG: hypothetical protein QOJ65_206, partial [Fimbriimonadaceae bacterium]|nr:hypothetical protein [Fimbriimonadaceae bacterium]
QEVAQATWIEAWTCIGKLSEPRAFASWLRQIAFRLSCNHLRKKKSLHSLPENVAYEPSIAWLWSLLRCLAPAQARVVKMHFEEGYTVNEIASQLAIPAGTVKSRIRLAKGVLRQRLEDK